MGSSSDMAGGDAPRSNRSWALPGAAALAIGGLCAILYVVLSATSKPDATGLQRFAIGAMQALSIEAEPPPQSQRVFLDAEGREVRLSDFRGRVLVVNFWATWCAPCRAEMPSLAALQERFSAEDVVVVPISIDNASVAEEAQALLAELSSYGLAFFIDSTRGVPLDVRAGLMPTTVIYDRDGVEAARLTGDADWASREAESLVRAIVARGDPGA